MTLQLALLGCVGLPLAVAFVVGALAAFELPLPEAWVRRVTALSVAALAAVPFVARAALHVRRVVLFRAESSGLSLVMSLRGRDVAIATMGLLIVMATTTFARRYLHRESGFSRFHALCLLFAVGFDLVALGGSLEVMLVGWELVGLASFFLIAFYAGRRGPRRNAAFAFATYRLGDTGLLFALVALQHDTGSTLITRPAAALPHAAMLASGLFLAALCKSGQFPLTGLLPRSMEGPTPSSALGYASLSAHLGVILLVRTDALWGSLFGMRVALVVLGLWTAIHASLVALTRADQKGVLAYATTSTVGLLIALVGLGFERTALVISMGHAAFRVVQVLRAPSALADAKRLRAALPDFADGRAPSPAWFRLAWAARRFDADLPELVLTLARLPRVRAKVPVPSLPPRVVAPKEARS